MAKLRWEVPVTSYPTAVFLLQMARKAEAEGDLVKLADLTERILKFPGYPKIADPHDTIEVVPKGGRVIVEVGHA